MLTIHKDSIDLTAFSVYPCNQCEYKAPSNGHLRAHVENKHEGIRYDCQQCNVEMKSKQSIRKHIELVHDKLEILLKAKEMKILLDF